MRDFGVNRAGRDRKGRWRSRKTGALRTDFGARIQTHWEDVIVSEIAVRAWTFRNNRSAWGPATSRIFRLG